MWPISTSTLHVGPNQPDPRLNPNPNSTPNPTLNPLGGSRSAGAVGRGSPVLPYEHTWYIANEFACTSEKPCTHVRLYNTKYVWWSQQVVEHLYSSLCSQNERTITEICPAHENIESFTKQLLAGVSDVACMLVFFSVLSISSMHAASGLFSWTMELVAFASREFAPKTMDVSFRFVHSHSVLPCERA